MNMDVQSFKEYVSKFTIEFDYQLILPEDVIVNYYFAITVRGKVEKYPFLAYIYRSSIIDVSLLGRGEREFVLCTPTYYYKLMLQNGRFRCVDKWLKG